MGGYLLFANERYGLPIVDPLARALQAASQPVATWFEGGASGCTLEGVPSVNFRQALAMRPRAILSALNWVPPFMTGAKVQLFHGFNTQKHSDERGHFRIRGLFDLYCTQGPATTVPFQQLAQRLGHFAVQETGWSKLDPLFAKNKDDSKQISQPAKGRPIILFGSTFTPRCSAAPHLYEAIAADIATGKHYWLLTLHPKCDAALFARYRALAEQASDNACFVEPEQVMSAQRAADVLLSDTSSIVPEFVVQHKPVVTFRNRMPQPYMLDFTDPSQLAQMLERALAREADHMAEIIRYAASIHPWRDGRSSERVLQATEDLIAGRLGKLKPKPLSSYWRSLQIRRELGYWGKGQGEKTNYL